MSVVEQIKDMCAIMSNASYADCEGTPLVPESSGICEYVDCHSCKQARLLTNAGYRKQEWISVEERLPEEDGEYLTWNGLIYYLITFNASLRLWNVGESGDISTAIRDVTHWMPLPEPPKGGEG
jgi:hypothetical protein